MNGRLKRAEVENSNTADLYIEYGYDIYGNLEQRHTALDPEENTGEVPGLQMDFDLTNPWPRNQLPGFLYDANGNLLEDDTQRTAIRSRSSCQAFGGGS